MDTRFIEQVSRPDIKGRSLDSMLVERVRGRDSAAMTEMFNLYHKKIFLIAVRILGSYADAQDVTQDILLKFWSDSSNYDSSHGALSSWLGCVARNKAIDLVRRRHRNVSCDFALLRAESDPSKYVSIEIQLARANRAIKNLSRIQRKTLGLAFRDELSHSEISIIEKIPIGTVKSRIRKSLLLIRRNMSS